MKTRVIQIEPDSPNVSDIKEAGESLRNGAIAALPTETVYGLAVNADDEKAVKRLYALKNRQETKPFTIQIAEFSQLKEYTDGISPELRDLLGRFWPGPLTVILQGEYGKTGLRMPANNITLAIIKETAIPLAVTSANLSGGEALSSAAEVGELFGGRIDLIIDDGRIAQGVESTVLDTTTSPFKILRRGTIAEELEKLINRGL